MRDKDFDKAAKKIRDRSDFWINADKETDVDHMYTDLLISIRNAILLLAEVVQTKTEQD